MNLKVCPKRLAEKDPYNKTGVYIRAQTSGGAWISADIILLDKPSLLTWLRSRGGRNDWAENTVAMILGHGHFEEEDPHPETLLQSNEYTAWQLVVAEFKLAIGDMNEDKYKRLIAAINLWSEVLCRLRFFGTEESLNKALLDKQALYNLRKEESK